MTASRLPTSSGSARILDWLLGSQVSEPAEIRTLLVATMISRRKVQVFGHVSVIAAALTAGFVTGSAWCTAWALADAALLVLRLHLYGRAARVQLAGEPADYLALVLSALAWIVLLSAGFAVCVLTGDPVLTLIAALNVTGIIGGISSRNAATPRFAMLMIWLIGGPFTLALLVSPIDWIWLVGLQAPLLVAGMCMVTLQNYATLASLYRAEYTNRMQALTDTLTGLGNRNQLRQALTRRSLTLATEPDDPARAFAVLCLDLDGFKEVNDRFGHGTGDALLQAVAGRLRLAMRQDDLVCRIGGDEFVVVVDTAQAGVAERVAERILLALQAPFAFADAVEIRVGVSIGSAHAPADGTDPKRLLLRADEALYGAKRAGKGVYRPYRSGEAAEQAAEILKLVGGGRSEDGCRALS